MGAFLSNLNKTQNAKIVQTQANKGFWGNVEWISSENPVQELPHIFFSKECLLSGTSGSGPGQVPLLRIVFEHRVHQVPAES